MPICGMCVRQPAQQLVGQLRTGFLKATAAAQAPVASTHATATKPYNVKRSSDRNLLLELCWPPGLNYTDKCILLLQQDLLNHCCRCASHPSTARHSTCGAHL
jgi:hypothetical protein